jgi:hypothetical protein
LPSPLPLPQIVSACNPEGSVGSSLLDREHTVDDITSFIIPILLDKGLLAPSPEGRGFSIGLLLRIVKTSKASLKDNLIRLVSVLVESMSAMEPRSLQYMEFHTERLNISSNELESTRLKLSQLSPLQDALDVCLESLQSPSCLGIVHEVITNLSLQTQQGIGLATRVSAVRSLLFLMNSCPHAWNPSSTQRCFLSLMIAIFPNPPTSESLRKDIIVAIGTISKICESTFLAQQVMKLIAHYRDLRPEDYILPKLIADCVIQIVCKAGEVLQQEQEMWRELLLCSYIGSFEENSEVQASWSQLFAEVVIQSGYGTRESAIKAVFTAVVQMSAHLMTSLSWNKRNQALSALNDLISLFPSGILAPNTAIVILSIFKVIPGQMWKGKENTLKSLALLIEKCPQCIDDQDSSSNLLSVFPLTNNSANANGNVEVTVMVKLEETQSRAGLLERINERLVLLSPPKSELSQEEEPVLPSNLGWRVSWKSLLQFFLTESAKGDRQYRLIAANAFASLPWNHLRSPQALSVTLSLLEEIATRAGMVFSSGHGEDQHLPPEREIIAKDSTTTQTAAQVDIFGGRYGQDFQVSKKMKRTKAVESYESEMLQLQQQQGQQQQEHREEGKIEEENSSATSPEATEAAAVAVNLPQPQTDAANRLKYLECLAKFWPSQNLDHDLLSAASREIGSPPQRWSSFAEFIPDFLDWALQISRREVWSIRKGILKVLTSFASYSLEERELHIALQVISETSSDPKYSQVRVASAEAIEQLLLEAHLSSQRKALVTRPEMSSVVSRIIANLSLDTTPAVLVHSSRAQQEWLKIKRENRL